MSGLPQRTDRPSLQVDIAYCSSVSRKRSASDASLTDDQDDHKHMCDYPRNSSHSFLDDNQDDFERRIDDVAFALTQRRSAHRRAEALEKDLRKKYNITNEAIEVTQWLLIKVTELEAKLAREESVQKLYADFGARHKLLEHDRYDSVSNSVNYWTRSSGEIIAALRTEKDELDASLEKLEEVKNAKQTADGEVDDVHETLESMGY
jgi:hypothetical protein